jgi:16S rRNA processing protein RimM
MDDLVAVAKVVKPKGLKGEVVAEILTDFPERFEGLKDVTAVLTDAKRLELKIEGCWSQNGRLVMKFGGIDSVDLAETLRNAEICVRESETVELEEGEFFDWQIEGCTVETLDGKKVGTVRELQRTGGTENLVVDGESKDFLIPFAEAICVEVDVEKKLIRIDPPEGLLEF